MELYRVIVKVYPTTESGEAAWKAQFGWVVGWVQSSSGEAAAENFQLFIDSLGTYERLSPSLVLALEESAHPLPDPKYDQYREAGRRNQPNLFVRWLAAGRWAAS